ncbi:hypothetical protein FOPG_10423 [Fusarium oxysporum f. sp. conglutinans race 2 54008]|nr:hypothetical protein FOPG_10423 [Fusarium oxysporum f. sp. conglutinans race 2 54008]KAI8403892.1 hypothetical protein FOFC_15383 [Fusarium oxysporum]
MCCGGDPTAPRPTTRTRSLTPSISSYTPDQKLRQDNVIHNMGWDKKGFSEKRQRSMAQIFLNEIQKAKDRGEWQSQPDTQSLCLSWLLSLEKWMTSSGVKIVFL